jgi:hypothetical protein
VASSADDRYLQENSGSSLLDAVAPSTLPKQLSGCLGRVAPRWAGVVDVHAAHLA